MIRKHLAGAALLAALAAGSCACGAQAMEQSAMKGSSVQALAQDTRVFRTDPAIHVRQVRFCNRYGFDVAGHLYLPRGFSASKRYAGLVLSGPFGAVKEQCSGLYAQEMARRGFVALAFDPSMTGESGGAARNTGSPEIFTEDFSAAVDFLGLLGFVDRDRLGAVGICGLAGPAVTAAAGDVRIKAVAVSAMYDMSSSMRDHYKGDAYTPAQREAVKDYLADMRCKEARQGQGIPGLHEVPLDAKGRPVYASAIFPARLPAGADAVTKEFFNYYRGRAYHERAINSTTAWTSTTPYGFFNFPLAAHVDELSPRPLLLVTGDRAHSRHYSETLYERAREPRELVVVPGATHTDLYDQMDKIPFDRLDRFFAKHLKR